MEEICLEAFGSSINVVLFSGIALEGDFSHYADISLKQGRRFFKSPQRLLAMVFTRNYFGCYCVLEHVLKCLVRLDFTLVVPSSNKLNERKPFHMNTLVIKMMP